MRLSYLMDACLHADYTHLPQGVDYAARRVGGQLQLYLEASNGSEDWCHNLDFPAAAYRREGRAVFYAHRGFLSAFSILAPVLDGLLCDQTLGAVLIVGYSHGAALGTLAHEYVWYHRPDLRSRLVGYGFGSPRVLFGTGRRELAPRWEGYTVVRNAGDIVTHLPPAFLGYYHVGELLTVGAEQGYSPTDAHRPENILRELRRAGL